MHSQLTGAEGAEFFAQQYQFQFEAILEAFNKLSLWLKKDFPEANLQVEFNDDSQNPKLPSFKIKTRMILDKSMDQNDQLLLKKDFTITPLLWDDPMLMAKWTSNILPAFQRSYSQGINAWWAKKKEQGTAL